MAEGRSRSVAVPEERPENHNIQPNPGGPLTQTAHQTPPVTSIGVMGAQLTTA